MNLKRYLDVMRRGSPKLLDFTMLRTDADILYKFITAVEQLRETQKMYMANRGNEEIGQAVAAAAVQVDQALAEINGDTPTA